MSKRSNEYLFIFTRYLFLIAVGFAGLGIFYFVFTQATINLVFSILKIFYNASLSGSTILIGQVPLEIIDACVAGSAYYLLLILNLSVPNLKINKRIVMIAFAFISFLLINILRIVILSFIALSGSSYFDVTHLVFWYVFSIVFVVGIWFIEVKIFKIKDIPFYSDIKYLINKSVFRKKSK